MRQKILITIIIGIFLISGIFTFKNKKNIGFAQSDTCSPSVSGYIWCQITVTSISSNADEWKGQLQNEIGKMVGTQAGQTLEHLRPFRAYYGEGIPVYVWGNPADNIYSLARAYPYLTDVNIKTNLRNYVQNELNNYSPLNYFFTPSNSGRSRNPNFTATPDEINLSSHQPTLWSLYPIWLYADVLGKDGKTIGWNWIQNNWSAIVNFFNQKSGSINTYEDIAGALAFVRMAYRQEGNSCGTNCTKGVNAATSGFSAGANYSTFYNNSANRYRWGNWETRGITVPYVPINNGQNWTPAGHGSSAPIVGAPVIFHLEPEIARFLKNNTSLKTNIQKLISDVERADPFWYVNHTPFFYDSPNLSDDGFFTYTESAYQFPGYFNWMIPAKSWIFDLRGDNLASFIDGPWSIGDLDYINNLVILIESYGTTKWCDVRDSGNCSF